MRALTADRDVVHKERVQRYMKNLRDYPDLEEDFFVSEIVDNTVLSPKALVHSFNLDRIIAQMPFNDIIYVIICPNCVSSATYGKFKTLVERNIITPILLAPYKMYQEDLADFVYNRAHVNRYEFNTFRNMTVFAESSSSLCSHCVGNWKRSVRRLLDGRPELGVSKREFDRFTANISPYVVPDSELLEEFRRAIKNRDGLYANALCSLSETIYGVRTSQAFNAPISLSNREFSLLPRGITTELDEAAAACNFLDEQVANGVGLRVRPNVKLDEYIDLIEDYRPNLSAIVSELSSGLPENKEKAVVSLQRKIMELNTEIDRIKNSRRNMILEAGIEFYGRNSILLNATITAGVFGLVGGLAGCASGAVASGAATIAGRKRWISGGPAVERYVQKLKADLQPFLSAVISKYVGSTQLAVNVMSIRRVLTGGA